MMILFTSNNVAYIGCATLAAYARCSAVSSSCFQPGFYSCLPFSELPSLLPIVDVAEALLHVRNGDWFLCLLVANVPDSFNEGNYSVSYFYRSDK